MSEDECANCLYCDKVGKCRVGINDEGDYFARWLRSLTYFGNGVSVAPYVATPCRVVRKMLSIAELKPSETVYDLGCGDGRIVILASGEFGARAVGYELDDDLVKKARNKVLALHLEDKATIVQDNLFNADVEKADVITIYLSPGGNQEVKLKLEHELKTGARVVSREFEIPGWKPHKVDKVIDKGLAYTIYLYKK